MGHKLLQFYKLVFDNAGIRGKTKLAQMTKIPSTRAALADDSPENLALFEAAVREILAEAVARPGSRQG